MTAIVPNLRDLGGTPAGSDVVRPGRLLRSAAPWAGDTVPGDVVWPPAVVVDLRSQSEVLDPHPLASAGAEVVNAPLLASLRPGVALAATLAELYLTMLDTAPHHLVSVVRATAGASGPVLVHCAAGKDRTGVSIALMLRLAGTDRDAVVADYLETERHFDAIQARLAGTHRVSPEFFATPRGAIEGVLDVWDDHPGGVHGWFLGAGGTDDDVTALRGRLLGEAA